MTDRPIFAFVLMPFDAEFDDVYKFGIKEAASELDINPQRVDEQMYKEGVLSRIHNQIDIADLIVADMSGRNPNVFYEVGFAHAKNKLVLHVTRDADDIPFDLMHQRHIVYGGSIKTLKEKLLENLRWAAQEIENYWLSHLRIKTSIYPDLEKTQYSATARLDFKVDLFNDSDGSSTEIESVTFYAGKEWTVAQNDVKCERGDSDYPPYKYQYLLQPPQRKIPRKSWIPLRFTANRVLARTYQGDVLAEKYPVQGVANLRIATTDRIQDHEIKINVVCEFDDIPF